MIARRPLVAPLAASLGFILVSVFAAHWCSASSVTLTSVRDNTLFEDTTGTGAISNGAGMDMYCGLNNGLTRRRPVFSFDVASAVPAGATVDSVFLTLHLSRRSDLGGGALPVGIHKILADWGEGTSNAGDPGGGGAPSTPGDATWFHTFFNTGFWATPGGDFAATASASRTVNAINFYTWGSTAQMVSDVQGWVNAPATDFGWLAMGDETLAGFAKRFDTKEDSTVAFHPSLNIFYHHPLSDVSGPGSGRDAVRLGPNTPNPFSLATTFVYSLDNPGRARLTVHDAAGRLVATIADRVEKAGNHKAVWDGRDERGLRVAPGVYFSRLEANGSVRAREVVLSR